MKIILTLLFAIITQEMTITMEQAQPNHQGENRVSQHTRLAKYLESLSEVDLMQLLNQRENVHSGWAKAGKIVVDGIPVFVKMLPLNDIEEKSENINSTKNLFDLPVFYQYGVRSGGFSTRR